MDRKIEKKPITVRAIVLIGISALVLFYIVYAAITSGDDHVVNADASRIQIVEVIEAPFQEQITATGTVVPSRSIFLDVVEGGRIDRILADAGSNVSEGDTILVLSNNNLQLEVMNRETQILEQINATRTTRIQLQQQRLSMRNDFLTHQTELEARTRAYERDQTLFSRNLISEDQFLESKRQYTEVLQRTNLYREQMTLDSLSYEAQFRHIDSSLQNMIRNLELVANITDHLVVKAPISGQLTSLDAEIGETKQAGQRLGQIDITDSYKIRAVFDEVYIPRIQMGQQADFDIDGQTYSLTVSRVYPEVSDGRFQVDLEFVGQHPASVRRGQTVRLRLALSDFSSAVLINRGAFFQATGGRWIFVLNSDGSRAYRTEISIGRQNSQFYVIENGLQPGDKVIISGYEAFGNATQLRLN
mgnify:CR=1 FL=1